MSSTSSVLSEYLIKLGFNVDTSAFSQFSNALRDAASITENQYSKMAKNVLEFQGAATGAFFSAGAAAIGIAEKTAMADQEYRLLALHMYTSLPVARELKIALDALGQPLENIMWDPELAKRFNQLVKDQRALTKELGPDFENQMLKIRDVRFEFTRFGVELQYLTMNVVKDLAQAFGMDMDTALMKMRNFNDWFIVHMPEISQWIATKLKPILIDVWDVVKATGGAVREGVIAFDNLIGLLSNDTSIQGTTLSFDKTATAIQHCIDALKDFLKIITGAETALSHLLMAATDALQGNFKGALSELTQANLAAGAEGHGAIEFQKKGSIFDKDFWNPGGLFRPAYSHEDEVKDLIVQTAKQLGVDPALALAVAQQESNFSQYDKSGNILKSSTGALGIMQLLPSTARGLGVNPNDPRGNVYGGEKYLQQLLSRYHGDQKQALEHYYGSKDAVKNSQYAREVMQREAGMTVNGDLHVTVQAKTDASPKDIADATVSVLHDLATKKKSEVQRNLAEQQNPSWSY